MLNNTEVITRVVHEARAAYVAKLRTHTVIKTAISQGGGVVDWEDLAIRSVIVWPGSPRVLVTGVPPVRPKGTLSPQMGPGGKGRRGAP